MYLISLDSQSPVTTQRLWQEVDTVLGQSDDPLEILITAEESDEPDEWLARLFED